MEKKKIIECWWVVGLVVGAIFMTSYITLALKHDDIEDGCENIGVYYTLNYVLTCTAK